MSKREHEHIPAARPCGRCGASIRPARTAAAGKSLWVDAEPVRDETVDDLALRPMPDEGVVAYRLDGVAVVHGRGDLEVFYPKPAFVLHVCP